MQKFYKVYFFTGVLFAGNTLHAQCPNLTIHAFPGTICAGETATLVLLGEGTYKWKHNNSSDKVITVNPTTNTPYTVEGVGCQSSITVMVNPLPDGTISGSKTVCARSVESIEFNGISGQSPFTFGYIFQNGNVSGSLETIEGSLADNKAIINVKTSEVNEMSYHFKFVIDANNCKTKKNDVTTITIKATPPNPAFTSNGGVVFQENLRLCGNSNNIDFNITDFRPNHSYLWTVTQFSSDRRKQEKIDILEKVDIKDKTKPNTAITFPMVDTDSINGRAGRIGLQITDEATNCTSTRLEQVVYISKIRESPLAKKIIYKQPGHMLIYPDNTIKYYQWGYNILVKPQGGPDYYSHPVSIPDQVFQFFTPDSKLLTDGKIDTISINPIYTFWVLIEDANGCQSRVYLNGPFKPKAGSTIVIDNPVELLVFPNPSRGNFDVSLKGNIYGNIHAIIYNATGQQVFKKNFLKTIPEMYEKFNAGKLSSGLYFLELHSSDLKKVVTRFIIQH